MIAYVFPGQGSQFKGMGADLFDKYPEYTKIADEVLGYSIKELCLDDPQDKLGQTTYTQPALYVVNALSYMDTVDKDHRIPDYVAGHSLGEYNALLAAGAFDFETGLRLVKKRGELMGQARNGKMAAVIGLSAEEIKEVLSTNNLESIDVANYNTLNQIAISGLESDILKAQSIFEEAGARYIILNVSGAFHSRYMQEAKMAYEPYINQSKINPLKIKCISNVYARLYNSKRLKETLADQIVSSVQWCDTIRYLMGKDVTEIKQIGPGRVVSGLVSSIQRTATPLIVDEIEEKDDEVVEVLQCEKTIKSESNEDKQQTVKKEKKITATTLGNSTFIKEYKVKYAYVAGGMYRAISSVDMVIRMAKAGFLCFLGTGGLSLNEIENSIDQIKGNLVNGETYGVNFLYNPMKLDEERQKIELLLRKGVTTIEAAAFMSVTKSLIRYRLTGITKTATGEIIPKNHIIAKVSHPVVANEFMSPANSKIVDELVKEGYLTSEEAKLSSEIAIADDICVEADSGGHTDRGVALTIFPAIRELRNQLQLKYRYNKKIRVGLAGGIGTSESAAAAFILGADFITTGSINQCTVEGGTSETAKDLLQKINIQDTDYCPAGDMFEMNAKVQVLKRGVFFPARANKLYEIYQKYDSIDEIDEKTKKLLEERYFHRTFEEIYEECKNYYDSEEIMKSIKNPKVKLAMILKWYFGYASQIALAGDKQDVVNYQVFTSSALGAFNQWVMGTDLEDWRQRHVDEIALKIMNEAAEYLNNQFDRMLSE